MHPDLFAAFAARQQLLTRRQVLALGLTGSEIDRLVRSDRWVAVRRAVYTPRAVWESLDEWRGRPLHRARAASLAMSTPHVMSHDSAALEHGVAVLQAQHSLVHVTRPGVLGSRTECGVKHHKAPYRADQLVVVDGRGVLDLARTVADIARDRGLRAGLVSADSALRHGMTRDQLYDAILAMRSWPGVTVSRDVADLADDGAENAAESLARELVIELGHGRPQTQFGLGDGRRTVWCDLRLGRHLFEVDGWLKYRPIELGGVATLTPEAVLRKEKERQDFLSGFKLGVSRLTWDDFWGQARERARRRLQREYADTCRRFGESIEDLTPFLVHSRRPLAG